MIVWKVDGGAWTLQSDRPERGRLVANFEAATQLLQPGAEYYNLELGYILPFFYDDDLPYIFEDGQLVVSPETLAKVNEGLEKRGPVGWFEPTSAELALFKLSEAEPSEGWTETQREGYQHDGVLLLAHPMVRFLEHLGLSPNTALYHLVGIGDIRSFVLTADPFDPSLFLERYHLENRGIKPREGVKMRSATEVECARMYATALQRISEGTGWWSMEARSLIAKPSIDANSIRPFLCVFFECFYTAWLSSIYHENADRLEAVVKKYGVALSTVDAYRALENDDACHGRVP